LPVLHVLRVFCAEDGSGGNRLGVFLDGGEVEAGERQAVAAELGYAETVFLDDRERGVLRILTPALELRLAGHPLVGTAWLLRHDGMAVETLRPLAGEVRVRHAGGLTWIAARAEWAPHFDFVELDSPAEVEALEGPPEGHGWVGAWAWLDRDAGLIRERVFVPEAGIAEDEATGAAAMLLADQLGGEIEIRQGQGSVIYARSLGEGMVEVGGRVELDHAGEWSRGEGRP
jgi:predicted PhzF superfamily epimerase YddE/YHI9